MVDQIVRLQAQEEQEEDYNTSEPEQVNKARKKAARTRADRLRFIEAAMKHEEGRAWFFDLLNYCKVFRTPYRSDDSQGTAFQCGEQNIGLQVLADIQDAAPDKYLQMIRENR